jgi:hypothetical protein
VIRLSRSVLIGLRSLEGIILSLVSKRLKVPSRSSFLMPALWHHRFDFATRIYRYIASRLSFVGAPDSSPHFGLLQAEFFLPPTPFWLPSFSPSFMCDILPLQIIALVVFLVRRVRGAQVWLLPSLSCSLHFDFCFRFSVPIECGSLHGEAGIVLESPDQKTRGFIVQIALPR